MEVLRFLELDVMILNNNGNHIKEYFDEQNCKQVLFDLQYREYYSFPIGLLERYGLTDGQRLLEDIKDYHCFRVQNKIYPDLSNRGVCECIGCNEEKVNFVNGCDLWKEFGQNGILLSVSREMYYNRMVGKQSAWEWFKFRCYLSLKSIIGKNQYKKTTNSTMLCRAAGYSHCTKESTQYHNLVGEDGKSFCTEYYCNKVRNELQEEFSRFWWYSHYTRGFYFTFKKSKKDLVVYAESRRPSIRAEKTRVEEQKLRDQVRKNSFH